MLASLEVLSYYIIQLTVCQELFSFESALFSVTFWLFAALSAELAYSITPRADCQALFSLFAILFFAFYLPSWEMLFPCSYKGFMVH